MNEPLERERWQRIEPLLDGALELPVDRRAPWLDEACAGDAQLRAQVEALLAAEQEAGEFLERPGVVHLGVPAPVAESSRARLTHRDGDRVGPYRVVRELGHGGMGIVYLAERADGQFEQTVALKLMRVGLPSEEHLQRFLRERQILARLQHPGIARLLDGGLADDGQPYFTMEYVDGVPITRYADEHRLGIEDRLRLVLCVCDALEYAHAAGVVHRDLKPANILVSAAGEPKLLDFGISRLLEEADDASATRNGPRPMTPGYAAPEQLRGEPVTAAVDVHGLGIVLYELLTGQHPFRRDEAEVSIAIERRVLEEDPAPPSRQGAEGRRLRGDLDCIVLRALEKQPSRRYGSVTALADDLCRYLAHQPVAARRGLAPYRLGKLIARHRTELRMAALAGILAAAGAFVALERDVSFGASRSTTLALAAGTTPAERMYEEGLRALHQHDVHAARRLFRAAVAEDSAFALAIYHTLRAEWKLLLPPDAALEARLRRLVDRLPAREQLVVRGRLALDAQDPQVVEFGQRLVSGYPDEPEGHLLLGRALALEWQPWRALAHLRRVVAMDSLALRGDVPACRACDAYDAIVKVLIGLDSLEAAERVAREWVGLRPASGHAWFVLGEALAAQNDTAASLAAFREAARHAPANAYIPIYPAMLDIRAGDFEAADRLLREQARAAPHDVRTEALWFLVISLRYQGRHREALATARALRQLRPDLREPIMAEAQVLFESGLTREAAKLFEFLAAPRVVEDTESAPAAQARVRSWHLTHVADARAAAGDTAGLEALADSIESLGARTLQRINRRLHHHVRGLLLVARGDHESAAREFRRATLHPDGGGWPFNRTSLELARVLLALDRPDEAVAALRPAIGWGLEASSFYATHTELHELLGRAHEAAGRADSARVHYAWALRAWRDADPELHARRAEIARRLP